MGTDIAKDVDDLPGIGIVIGVKGKCVLQRDVGPPRYLDGPASCACAVKDETADLLRRPESVEMPRELFL